MSEHVEVERIRDRLAGKWQIPLLLVSVSLLAAALLQVKPPEGRVPLETLLKRLSTAIDGRMYDLAISDSDYLLKYLQEHRPEVDVGPVYLQRARAMALKSRAEDRKDPDSGRAVLAAYELTRGTAAELEWVDHRNRAWAYEWMGSWGEAIAAYEKAVVSDSPRRLSIKRRIIEVMVLAGMADAKREAKLDELIELAGERPDLLYWAVDGKIDLLTRSGRAAEALTLLDNLAPVYEPMPGAHRFGYLRGLALYKASRLDEAEAVLRDLRNNLVLHDDVHAMSGWLLGRTVLFDDGPQRPQEALSFFREVVSSHASGLYVDASRLGMAESLAILERYPESLEQFERVIESLPSYVDSELVNRRAVRLATSVVADGLRSLGNFRQALAFLEPAYALVDPENVDRLTGYLERLGTWRALLAGELGDEADALEGRPSQSQQVVELKRESSELYSRAADAFLEVARLNTLREARSATATWKAAELLDEAGDRERTIEVLAGFVKRRPGSSLAPRALYRLGQSYQAMGRYVEAVEAYQKNLSRFPRTPDAGSGLIPLANCFVALGGDYFKQAEKTLRLILDDSPIFTPQAPEFADALFLLGDLMSRTAQFEEAIPLLSEARQRYPEDLRSLRAEFLLADAYRQSGLGLRQDLADPQFVGERDRLVAESTRRIDRAAELFGQLEERFEGVDESMLTDLESLHLRYARLYGADCWYELGRYEQALKSYERAAWIYRDSPSSLAAYGQIINCHAHLSRPREARAALRRAEYLLGTMHESAFGEPALNGDRNEWEQYFQWLDRAELF